MCAEHKIIDEVAERDTWDNLADGKSKKSLEGIVRRRKTSMKKLGAVINTASDGNSAGATGSAKEVDQLLDEVDKFLSSEDDVVDDDDDEIEIGDVSVSIPDHLPDTTKSRITRLNLEMKEAADKLKPLAAARRQITVRLNDTRKYLRDLKKQMKEFRKLHKKDTEGLHNKLMDVLKKVGVELQAYHGGSLNGKDIIKVMNNASYIFDQFASLLNEGKRDRCTLT